jgi:hypothetical protein
MWTPDPPRSILAGRGRAVSRLKRLIQEIHRRSLWQVLGIYLVGAWVAFQGVEALVSGLGLPEWVPGFAVVLLIVGLPIVLATAFVREGAGAEETPDEAEAGNGDRRLWTVLATTAAVLLLVGVGLWAVWPRPLGLLIDVAGVSGPPVNPPVPEKPSIVVLPFTNMSRDPDQEYFSDGPTDDIITALSRTSSFRTGHPTEMGYRGGSSWETSRESPAISSTGAAAAPSRWQSGTRSRSQWVGGRARTSR